MNKAKIHKQPLLFILVGALLLMVLLLNISLGSVRIPMESIWKSILNIEQQTQWSYIINAYRIPKAFTAVLVGAGLSVSGLLMQTLFKNPLAGPYVLGISSGASLGAALYILGGTTIGFLLPNLFSQSWNTTLAASAGSFLVLFIIAVVASKIKNTMALLIIGLMFGSLSGALVSILAFFSSKESLQRFVFWSYGSLGHLTPTDLKILGSFVGTGIVISLLCVKPLNALLLGNDYAKSIGVSLKRNSYLIILATGLMAGSITAFAGPIAFLGLAVPHICRLIWNTNNHKVLLPATILLGSIFMLVSDTIAQLPGSANVLPINAITVIFGAPIVIWLLMRKKQIYL